VYDDPSTITCMKAMQKLAAANWEVYSGPETRPLPHGHLMPYPNVVGEDGSVTPLPDCEEFPGEPPEGARGVCGGVRGGVRVACLGAVTAVHGLPCHAMPEAVWYLAPTNMMH